MSDNELTPEDGYAMMTVAEESFTLLKMYFTEMYASENGDGTPEVCHSIVEHFTEMARRNKYKEGVVFAFTIATKETGKCVCIEMRAIEQDYAPPAED